jgi:hypothetical protein
LGVAVAAAAGVGCGGTEKGVWFGVEVFAKELILYLNIEYYINLLCGFNSKEYFLNSPNRIMSKLRISQYTNGK